MRRLSVCLGIALIFTFCASPAFAQGGNVAKGLLDSFVGQTDNWWSILRGYALFLFSTTLILEVCLFGIRMALQRSDIGETLGQFVTLLLFAGFIAAVIMNYQDWATGIAVKGLKPLTGELTGNNVDAGKPMAIAAILLEKIMLVMKNAGVTDIGMVMLYELVLFIIIVVFVLISALIIVTTCEFYIVANIGILLVGLGGSKIFKDYAVNVMRYVLAVAIKLFVLQLIVNIGMALISLADIGTASGSGSISTIKFVDLFYIIGKGVILLALAKTLPETCAGIVNGSAIGGGNPLVSMGRTAGAFALGAAAGGIGFPATAASVLNNAHTVARDQGAATGVLGTMRGMGRAMLDARSDAKAGQAQKDLDQNPGSIRNQLKSAGNAVKARKALEEAEDKEKKSGASGQAAPSFEAADGYEQAASVGGAQSSIPAADGYQAAEAAETEPPEPPDSPPPSAWSADGYQQAAPLVEKFAADGYSPEISNQGFNPTPEAMVDSASPKQSEAPDGYSQAASSLSAADGYEYDEPHTAAAVANGGHVVRSSSPVQSKPDHLTLVPASGKKRRKSRNRKRKH